MEDKPLIASIADLFLAHGYKDMADKPAVTIKVAGVDGGEWAVTFDGTGTFSFSIAWNGFPAGEIDPGGGVICAGELANEETLQAALEAEIERKKRHPMSDFTDWLDAVMSRLHIVTGDPRSAPIGTATMLMEVDLYRALDRLRKLHEKLTADHYADNIAMDGCCDLEAEFVCDSCAFAANACNRLAAALLKILEESE